MAEISISRVLNSRRKIRILTICASLVLIFFLVQLLVVKNPWGAKAATYSSTATSCTFTGAGVYAAGIPASCENKDIVINGSTLYSDTVDVDQNTRATCGTAGTIHTCDSKRQFASLTIENNGVLTHSNIATADMAHSANHDSDGDGSLADEPTGIGRTRRVDLVIAGDLTIQSGGKINVNGKGYPGGVNGIQFEGFGPGGGGALSSAHASESHPGGGGYGGRGGMSVDGSGADDDAVGGITYGSASNPIEWGSGGGGYYATAVSGGSGGGRVNIQAGRFVLSGASAITAQGDPAADAGGGSGGTINLRGGEFVVPSAVKLLSARGGTGAGGSGMGGGGRVSVIANTLNYSVGATPGTISSYIDVEWGETADMRRNNWAFVGFSGRVSAGEQGTINTEGDGSGSGSKGSNMKKELIAAERFGAPDDTSNPSGLDPSPHDGFNPYSLQSNDIIRVEITVSNLIAHNRVTVTDDWLKLPDGSMSCVPITTGGSYAPSPSPSAWGTPVNWTDYDPNSDGDTVFSYFCKVQ